MKVNQWFKSAIGLGVVLLGLLVGTSVYAADSASGVDTPGVQVLHRLTAAGDIRVVRIALQPDGYLPAAHSARPAGNIDLQLVSRSGSLVLIGRRLVSFERGHFSQTFFEEVSVRIPHYRLSMGWDVKALERELERLGVKVKPPAGVPVPRPVPPAAGGA